MFFSFFSSELIFRAFYLHHDALIYIKYKDLCKKGLPDNLCSYRHSQTFYIRVSIVLDKRLRQLLKWSILVSSCRFLFLFASFLDLVNTESIQEFDPIHVHPYILLQELPHTTVVFWQTVLTWLYSPRMYPFLGHTNKCLFNFHICL